MRGVFPITPPSFRSARFRSARIGPVGRALLLAAALALPLRAADEGTVADASAALHVRYAEARLKLARLDLERAMLLDERAGGAQVSETDMRRLRARVLVLERLVEATRLHPHGNGIEAHKARARAAVEVAVKDLESVTDAAPEDDAMRRIIVDRYRSRLEIARLRLAVLEDPTNVPSPFDQMQLQIDQLADHVVDLLDMIENQDTIIPAP